MSLVESQVWEFLKGLFGSVDGLLWADFKIVSDECESKVWKVAGTF